MGQLEALCAACGRCCNGVLFPATVLDGGGELPQPCPHLGPDRRCAVYASRPRACAGFLCPLARALELGELVLEAALARLRATTGLPVP